MSLWIWHQCPSFKGNWLFCLNLKWLLAEFLKLKYSCPGKTIPLGQGTGNENIAISCYIQNHITEQVTRKRKDMIWFVGLCWAFALKDLQWLHNLYNLDLILVLALGTLDIKVYFWPCKQSFCNVTVFN